MDTQVGMKTESTPRAVSAASALPAPASSSLVQWLLGDEEAFGFEHRVSNALMLVIATAAVVAMVYNVTLRVLGFSELGGSVTMNYVLGLTGLSYAGLYLWSRRGRSFTLPAWLSLIGISIGFYPALWISSYGTDGNMPLLGLGIMAASASVFSGWRRNMMLAVTTAVTIGLMLGEHYQIVELARYSSPEMRYIDVFSTMIQVAIPLLIVVVGMRANYHYEREKTNAYALLLEKTNRQLKAALERNVQLAHTDALTGLPNRRLFESILTRRVFEAERYERALSIALIDVDHFKSINDTHGHVVGDQVLSVLGSLLREQLRVADLCARWGGEEFALLCPEATQSGILALAERLRVLVQAHAFPCDLQVTISVGVATWQSGDSEESFFSRADRALYAAKDAGRNRVLSGESLAVDASVSTKSASPKESR